MSQVDRNQAQRDEYLIALYELSDGIPTQWATHRQIAERSGLSEEEVMSVGQAVTAQRHAEFVTMGALDGSVAITASGVRKAEQLIKAREPRSTGVILTDAELLQKLEPVLAIIRFEIENDTSLDPDTRSNLRADLESVEIQTKAAKPNRRVIKAAFDGIRAALPAAALLTSLALNIETIIHGLGL